MSGDPLPLGKLPIPLLSRFLGEISPQDPDVLVGPGIGMDAAVIRFQDVSLVFKTDPITFATDDIAWYLVTINANDIVCMGGIPEYILVTVLLPEGSTTEQDAHDLLLSLKRACDANEVVLAGGHTEIT
ncbi:MAG TPA: AIR synthase related protein, partial [Deltaproteobacteria bacterium]|nr:AIR synthase related protein [Deltaproteobacteria bacterium]